jgi:hypothetical protein
MEDRFIKCAAVFYIYIVEFVEIAGERGRDRVLILWRIEREKEKRKSRRRGEGNRKRKDTQQPVSQASLGI